jgi:hypothetical protein
MQFIYLKLSIAADGRLLKEQFYSTYESFKPVNLLRNTLHDISSSPNLIDNILGTALGLATGLISNIVFKGMAGTGFKKLISPVLQSGVTNFVAQHTGSLRSIGEIMLLRIFRKKRIEIRKP